MCDLEGNNKAVHKDHCWTKLQGKKEEKKRQRYEDEKKEHIIILLLVAPEGQTKLVILL